MGMSGQPKQRFYDKTKEKMSSSARAVPHCVVYCVVGCVGAGAGVCGVSDSDFIATGCY